MQSIIPLIIIGMFVYLMFSRRGGGMGCCGSHGAHDSDHAQDTQSTDKPSHETQDNVIDLREGEYTILSPKGDKRPL